ncbi:MAG: ROK family protein [Candidatus Saccharibacteria bacterium]|nr:ROK family protein [Candidatus Saccharibacteria bacterium]
MYLAIDIGGTKTLIALFSDSGRVVKKIKFKTARGFKRFSEDLLLNLQPFARRKIACVVVAIPGIVQNNCSVRFGNRDWGEVNIIAIVKKLFSCPIYQENDANLATIYESKDLSGKTIFLTFSTGIGGGIALDGKLDNLESSKFEPGHIIYDYDGIRQEWEDFASAKAIENLFHVDVATGLRGIYRMREIGRRIGLGLEDIVNKYEPDTIIIGGPLGKIFRRFVGFLPKLNVKYRRPRRPLESVIYGCYILGKNQK